MEDSKEHFNSESAKSLPNWSAMRGSYMFYGGSKPLKPQDIKMVGARGFEPRTPTVSR